MKRQEIELIKSFMALQENITGEKQKLSDKYHDLELSHNRKIKALEKIKSALELYPFIEADKKLKQKLIKYCTDALFSNGRERQKPFNYYKAWQEYKKCGNN